jgi:hypothetical protein
MGGESALAQKYDYGKYSTGGDGGGGEGGFFIYADALATNPRNTDNVVATFERTGFSSPLIPQWESEFSGRLGFGYGWDNGNRVEASVWGFTTDSVAFTGGATGDIVHFSIGPPICSVTPCAGANGSPGVLDITTEITAQTADLTWGRDINVTDDLSLGLSMGVRFASYEETAIGSYGDTLSSNTFDASKSNEGTMFGVRIAASASYRFVPSFSISGSIGFSALDGELEASSGLVPTSGQALSQSFASVFDDSRSGTILDIDLKGTWHLIDDRLRFSFGWEQSNWEGIAADLMRNFTGSTVILRDRDSVVFSSYKLGVYFRF